VVIGQATEAVNTVRRFVEARAAALDLDSVSGLASHDFVRRPPPAPAGVPKVCHGEAAFLEFFGGAAARWTNFALTQRELHGSSTDPS
jgi:hypothetical protein